MKTAVTYSANWWLIGIMESKSYQYQVAQASRFQELGASDTPLILAIVSLLAMGWVMVFSATVAADSNSLAFNTHHLLKHSIHISLGVVLLVGASRIPLDWLQISSKVILLVSLLLLGLLFIPGLGVEVNGSLRWFDFGGFRMQPSELMKIAALVYFADYLARKREDLHLFKVGIINVGLVVGVIGLLLLVQPDFGTTVVLVTAVAGMMFLAGVRFWHFLVSISVAAALMTVLMWMEPYRVARLLSYRDPFADPFGSGFQLAQALIAIGRGEWFGIGLGSSIQKLFYLPHAGNDFLIAVIGEELGAVGIFSVLFLFGVLLWRAFAIGSRALDQGHRFAGFLAQGVGLLLCLQAIIHIAVNTGLLPTKGITLPLMSYGGSSMLSSMLAVGLLLGIDRQCRPTPRAAR